MRQISVEYTRVMQAAQKVASARDEYQNLYRELYANVDKLQNSWSGSDNQAFTTKIKSYEEDLRRIALIMGQYSDFLSNSARAYESTQNELVNQVNRLSV